MKTRRTGALVVSWLPALVPFIAGQGCQGLRYTLTTQVAPEGGGMVDANPAGSQYANGTQVTLTATPTSNWHFDHWEGDLAGSVSPLTVTMDGNKTVTAVFASGSAAPGIVLDHVPAYGSNDDLRGHVVCVTPSDYRIAVYIRVSGWWTKPSFAAPLTTIESNGAWSTDITTGGSDASATDIAVFLVANGYTPPTVAGDAALPQELYTNAAAYTSVTGRDARTITFAGHTWQVKAAASPAGPGPNYFSADAADVWVDDSGYLHLNVVQRDGRWYCTEVICTDVLEYGTYTITLGSRVDLLDKNLVLGFFSWDTDAPAHHYREIDIEFSRWGEDGAPNAQYVIQPWDVSGNRYRYAMSLTSADSVHRFDWRADRVQFDSRDGNGASLQSWTFTNAAAIPPPGAGNARINLWLLNGSAPSDGQKAEVIVKSFQFTPASP